MSKNKHKMSPESLYMIQVKVKLANFATRLADAVLVMECGNEIHADNMFNLAVGEYYIHLQGNEGFDRIYNMGLAALEATRHDFHSPNDVGLSKGGMKKEVLAAA